MPIQKIVENGQTYYRYGYSGKMYKTKQEAEKQQSAVHAAGYKEPVKKDDKK